MEWLARNAEFLSPDAITKCLLAFKDLYNTEQVTIKNAFIAAKHTSSAAITVLHLLDHAKQIVPRDEETMSRLAILASILEPLLINDMNLEKSIEARLIDLLVSLLFVPQEVKDLSATNPDEARKALPVYLKYTLRCVTSAVRSPLGVADLTRQPTAIS